ncbi:TPA: hypothetical protein RQK80_004948 [Vibrio vulnificus]|nr:hypothetical protein [Vibrio vulnificus]HDY8044383.1 hypothetical protein [Vibrio vulnificus]
MNNWVYMRIIKQVIVLVSVCLLLSCAERVDRTDLQELIKNRQFSSLIEVVDGYIEENEDDEFGYYAKAAALIHLKKESSDIQSVLHEAFSKSPQYKVEVYSLSMSVMLLQNGYCDASLPVASKMGFDLSNPKSPEFTLLATGYVDCISVRNDKPINFVIGLYERLLIDTWYEHELMESYLTYLAKIDKWDIANDAFRRYNLRKPKSEYLEALLLKFKEASSGL